MNKSNLFGYKLTQQLSAQAALSAAVVSAKIGDGGGKGPSKTPELDKAKLFGFASLPSQVNKPFTDSTLSAKIGVDKGPGPV